MANLPRDTGLSGATGQSRLSPDYPVGAAGLSSETAGLSGKNSRNQTPKRQILSKSNPIFTKIRTGCPGAIPKLFPKNHLKMITGVAGISDLVKWTKLGQEWPKLTNDLLVAILQD